MSIIQGNTKVSAAGYDIPQSIRFNDDDSAYLTRTPASAGNQKTWTWSGWVKNCSSSGYRILFGTGSFSGTANDFNLFFNPTTNQLRGYRNSQDLFTTSARYLDPSAWYHIVWSLDTTDATANNRQRIYVNGEEITDFSTAKIALTLNGNYPVNSAIAHGIARAGSTTSYLFDGYMAEINFIDGQALDPTSFGKYDSVTGVWVPKAYSGSYGTNGFKITGENSADLGADYSGNGNDFTSSGLTTADQVTDTPTNNFATFSPINLDGVTLADGNLKCNNAGWWNGAAATMSLPTTGKWYIETLCGSRYGTYGCQGFAPTNYDRVTQWAEAIYYGANDSTTTPNYGLGFQGNSGAFGFYATSGTTSYSVTEPDGSTVASTNDLYICHAIDLDNERYWVGTAFTTDSSVSWFGPSGIGADPETPSTGLDISSYLATYGSQGLTFFHGPNAASGGPFTAIVDFGQSGFTFTKPTGYSELCTANLPEPTIKDGSAYFQTSLWSGNSSTQEINQTGNSTFQPDLVWFKSRSTTYNHQLQDAIRGVGNALFSNLTNAEGSYPSTITSLDADGFTLGSDAGANQSGQTYVGWQWLAGNGTSQNADGSIASTVSVNQTAKFSIATFTAPASGTFSVGHGLGAVPKFTTLKRRDSATGGNWQTWHIGLGDNLTDYLFLSTSGAEASYSTMWGTDGRTSSVCGFTIGGSVIGNGTYVLYSFAEVEGFSKFGSYTGNGSADGPFVWCGFRPAYVCIKVSSTTGSWFVYDTARDTYNASKLQLFPNLTSAEDTSSTYDIDILSNGFKIKSSNGNINTSSGTHVFMAFAENPFKYSLAR